MCGADLTMASAAARIAYGSLEAPVSQPGEEIVAVPPAPGGVSGSIRVPPSKSLTQRALLAAALAGGGSTVQHALDAEDPRLLFAGLRALGFRLEWSGDTVTASGRDPVSEAALDLGNNGTGARFLLAQLAALPGTWTLDGTPRLRERPMADLVAALRGLGAEIEAGGAASAGAPARLPLRVRGRPLAGGEVSIDASASSQFVSALLLLGAALPAGLTVRLDREPPSRPYLDLTAEVLAAFGAAPRVDEGGRVLAAGGGRLVPAAYPVEGDWSAAAFPLAAAAVAGGRVEVEGVRRDSRQGDAVVLRLLARAGCTVRESARGVVLEGPAGAPLEAELRDMPDLFPALAVVVATAGGRLHGLRGLAGKESDRLAVMTRHLAALGFTVAAGADWFASRGGAPRTVAPPVALDPAADHRIAMALAVAGTVVPGVRVAGAACVAKSWPGFWSDWRCITEAGA